MDKFCLDCGSPIKGRADKKFCDDQCRSDYNNRLKAASQVQVKKINLILQKNRKVLEKLNPDGKVKVTRARMEKEGFNFAYFTHFYDTLKGSSYKFCYEYGYLELSPEQEWRKRALILPISLIFMTP